MLNNFSFHKSVIPPYKNNVPDNYWDTVLKLYEDKQYKDCIRGILHFVDPDIDQKYANADKTVYEIPHGSVIVHIYIDDVLKIEAPFLNIEQAKKVPILRQVAQINFYPLSTSRIDLEDNKLLFRYEVPLELCEPYKIYDVLREICINADIYDDDFIDKFNASHIVAPKIRPFSDAEKQSVWEKIELYIEEANYAYDYLENKRITQYLWDVLAITILKIDYLCSPQGSFRNQIERTMSFLNSKADYYQRLNESKNFLEKNIHQSKDEFLHDLYYIDTFIPYKYNINLDGIRKNLKYAYDNAQKEIQNNDYIGAMFSLEYGIYNLFYSNNIESNIAAILEKAMQDAANKPDNVAANTLYQAVHQIMTNDKLPIIKTEDSQTKKKGFFSKIFNKN
ncbi:MAG: hypothetical protein R2801_03675 [Chitinophagales bacterium]